MKTLPNVNQREVKHSEWKEKEGVLEVTFENGEVRIFRGEDAIKARAQLTQPDVPTKQKQIL